MATRQSTSRGRPRRNPAARPQSKAVLSARTPGRDAVATEELARFPEYLRGLIVTLQRIMDVVIVSVAALQHQNADLDSEVARVLRSYAGNKLYLEIESATKLLRELERSGRARAKP